MSSVIEREQQVIAHLVNIMFDTNDCSQVMANVYGLSADDFESQICRIGFDHITRYCESRESFDVFELAETISKDERYQNDVGASGYLMQWQKDLVGASSTLNRAVKDVKKNSVKRQANNFINAMQRRINEEETPQEVIQDAISYFETLSASVSTESKTRHIGEYNAQLMQEIQDALEGKPVIKGIQTGLDGLDELLGDRGMAAGDLVVVAARPSMGKSSLAIKMMESADSTGEGIVPFFSLEMSGEAISKRMMHNMTGTHFGTIVKHGAEDADLVGLAVEYNNRTHKSKIYINDDPVMNIYKMRAELQRLKSKGNMTAAFVDYLGLMELPNESRHDLSIAAVTRQLKIMAKEFEMPIVLLCQLNRGVESRPNKRPNNADLRDSGAIEQDADIIIFPYRDEMYNEYSPAKGVAELIVSKNREGDTGTAAAGWDRGRFTNIDLSHAMSMINQSKESA